MTLGPDILLDPDTHDLLVVDGDLVVGVSVPQAVKIRLLWVLGEWFFDTTQGVPYFEHILGKARNLDQIRSIFRDTILGTPGVGELEKYEVTYDGPARRLDVVWQSTTAEGVVSVDVRSLQ